MPKPFYENHARSARAPAGAITLAPWCEACGSAERLTIDHKTPQARGGSHGPENLWTLCNRCNASKRHKTVQEWLSSGGAERRVARVMRQLPYADQSRNAPTTKAAAQSSGANIQTTSAAMPDGIQPNASPTSPPFQVQRAQSAKNAPQPVMLRRSRVSPSSKSGSSNMRASHAGYGATLS